MENSKDVQNVYSNESFLVKHFHFFQLDFYWPVLGAWLCGAAASVADPGLSVEVIKAQILDTRARVAVVSFEAVPKYLEANARLAEEDRVGNILVIDRDPWHDLPPGCSSFRELYNDDGSMCPKTLPGKIILLFLIMLLIFNPQKRL